MALYQYNGQLMQAVSQQNGEKLAGLLSKPNLRKKRREGGFKIQSSVGGLEQAVEKLPNIEEYCNGQVQSPYDEIMSHHFKALITINKSKFTEAYTHQSNLADAELRAKSQSGNRLEDTGRLLQQCYSICIRDNSLHEGSKKRCTFHIINQLFRIYFSVKKAKNCKSLIRPVEMPTFPALSNFPVSQVVTYKYFVGRLNMYDGNLKKAESELSFAFSGCTKKSPKNKRSILIFLVPVKIILGKMPSIKLLEKYDLPQFIDIVKSVKTGNIKLFNDALTNHYQFFAQRGVYLTLERAKNLVYRTLFKKIFFALNKQTKIKLQFVQKILEWLEVNMDLDEIECVIANLIFKGYIKGYLSHQMRVLVVSATKAFPPISAIKLD